jgi:hypothetical protein
MRAKADIDRADGCAQILAKLGSELINFSGLTI